MSTGKRTSTSKSMYMTQWVNVNGF